jgi:hypothetical protein
MVAASLLVASPLCFICQPRIEPADPNQFLMRIAYLSRPAWRQHRPESLPCSGLEAQ